MRFSSLDDRLAVLVEVCHALVHQARCEQQDTQGQNGRSTVGKPPEDGKGDAKNRPTLENDQETNKSNNARYLHQVVILFSLKAG